MTVADRIRSDKSAVQAGTSDSLQYHVAAADVSLVFRGLPSYSEIVNTLLAWNRASDSYKAERLAAQLAKRPRTKLELSEVHRLEEVRRHTTHTLNGLIDRLPRGL